MTAPAQCDVCQRVVRKCPCLLVAYCGHECQMKGWPAHAETCIAARKALPFFGGGPLDTPNGGKEKETKTASVAVQTGPESSDPSAVSPSERVLRPVQGGHTAPGAAMPLPGTPIKPGGGIVDKDAESCASSGGLTDVEAKESFSHSLRNNQSCCSSPGGAGKRTLHTSDIKTLTESIHKLMTSHPSWVGTIFVDLIQKDPQQLLPVVYEALAKSPAPPLPYSSYISDERSAMSPHQKSPQRHPKTPTSSERASDACSSNTTPRSTPSAARALFSNSHAPPPNSSAQAPHHHQPVYSSPPTGIPTNGSSRGIAKGAPGFPGGIQIGGGLLNTGRGGRTAVSSPQGYKSQTQPQSPQQPSLLHKVTPDSPVYGIPSRYPLAPFPRPAASRVLNMHSNRPLSGPSTALSPEFLALFEDPSELDSLASTVATSILEGVE
ncbi:hypothetical protein DIPPA_26479 [Diplonema papillatum]|nr:hypothetical protein DIPPA_26479 [Diplonema papillatum]